MLVEKLMHQQTLAHGHTDTQTHASRDTATRDTAATNTVRTRPDVSICLLAPPRVHEKVPEVGKIPMTFVAHLQPRAESRGLSPAAVSHPGGPLQSLYAVQDGQEGRQQMRRIWPTRAHHLCSKGGTGLLEIAYLGWGGRSFWRTCIPRNKKGRQILAWQFLPVKS